MLPLHPHTLQILVILTALAGCLSLPANPEKMTPEQLTAWAKDKNANIACATGTNVAGRGNVAYVVIDKGAIQGSSVQIDPDCSIKISAPK